MTCRFGSSDANLLGVCEEGGFVNIFRSGEDMRFELLTPVRRWMAHRDAIFDLCWTMEDRRLLTGSGDYNVCLWDTETMGLVSTFRGHTGSVKALKCHNYDDHVFASAGRDGNILLWDVRVQEKRTNLEFAVKPPVLALHGAHAMRRPGAAGRRTPSSSTPSSSSSVLPVPDAERGLSGAKSVTGLAFALDDTILVSSGADGRIKYWDVRKISFLTPVGVPDPRPVVSLNVKPPPPAAGPVAAAAPVPTLGVSSRPHGITCISLNRFGNRLAAYSLDNHIYEFDFYAPDDVGSLRCFDAPVTSFYAKIAYSPDGSHLVAGSSAMHVSVYDMRSPESAYVPGGPGAGPLRRLEGHSQSVFAVDWSGGMEQEIASCSDDGTTRLWTIQANRPQLKRRRQEQEQLELEGNVPAVAAVFGAVSHSVECYRKSCYA